MSSHFDWTSLVNKGFIIWPKRELIHYLCVFPIQTFFCFCPFCLSWSQNNILPYKSGFLLTKCFQKQAKFCVVRTGPEAKRYLDRCLLMSSSSSWKSIVSDGDIISDTKGENAAQGSMHRCKHTEGTLQQYLVQFSFFWKFWMSS